MKKKICYITIGILVLLTWGCTKNENKLEKVKDLEFTVVAEEKLPEELLTIIGEKNVEEFKMTYTNNEYLYICVGYGEQQSGGYSVSVNELYLTPNAIYVDTSLLGPSLEDSKKEVKSYPYVVLKTEAMDKTVVFD